MDEKLMIEDLPVLISSGSAAFIPRKTPSWSTLMMLFHASSVVSRIGS